MSTITQEITRLQTAKVNLKTSIEAKGVTVSADATLDQYPALVDSIPSGGGGVEVEEKDVNFYDYDGKRLYSYTKDEFLALTEMPANPNHTDIGLTAQGWNWSLADAKLHVTELTILSIGQLVCPTGNKTKIVFNITEPNTTVGGRFYYDSDDTGSRTCLFDWGDETSDTYTVNWGGSTIWNHTYQNIGEYNLLISCEDSKVYGLQNDAFDNSTKLLVKGLYLSDVFSFGKYGQAAVNDLLNLEVLTFSKFARSYKGQQLDGFGKIKIVIIPDSVDSYIFNSVRNCWNLERVCFPVTFTQSSNNISTLRLFENVPSLEEIITPYLLTNMGSGGMTDYSTMPQACKKVAISNLISSISSSSGTPSINFQKLENCYGMSGLLLVPVVRGCNLVKSLPRFLSATTVESLFVENMAQLEELYLGPNITELQSYCIQYCTNLKRLFVLATTPPTLGTNNFKNCHSDFTIYVPSASVEDYKAAQNWSSFAAKIQAIPE